LTGIVEEVIFLGDRYRVKLRLCADTCLDLVATRKIMAGEQMRIELKEGDLLLLPG